MNGEPSVAVRAASQPAFGLWLLLIYRLPSDQASARAAVWRGIKRLGALSLQRGVWLLPSLEVNRLAYRQLAERIESSGGTALLLEVGSPNSAWHAAAVARFNVQRGSG
jgi:DNA-binding transcriptional regulator PaaX